MAPTYDNQRRFFRTAPPFHTRFSSFSAASLLQTLILPCLRLRHRSLELLFFSLYLLLLSFTFPVDFRSLLSHFIPFLALSSGPILVTSLCLPSPRLHHILPFLYSVAGNPTDCLPSGTAALVYSNGDVYEGELLSGKRHGTGVYYYYNSGKYEGDWINAQLDGYGVETWSKGSRYKGQYKKGLRNGFGVFRFHTGDVYSGQWLNGQIHGYGTHTCEDGSRYVGDFKQGIKHGFGHYRFRNRDTFSGEFVGDKMHGYGVYHFANQQCYEGQWQDGKRHGLGLCLFANSDTQSGQWANGLLETSSTRNPFSGAFFAINHSKVLNAVQEAREVAQKAYNLPKVDDRVNKAVVAANKAADAARAASDNARQTYKWVHSDILDFPIPLV